MTSTMAVEDWEQFQKDKQASYISMNHLKKDFLYRIHARNARHGIWIPDLEGFLISRFKFGDNYLFVEHHWDCEAFATAKPLKEIEKSPFRISEWLKSVRYYNVNRRAYRAVLKYLNKQPEARARQLGGQESDNRRS